MKSGKPFLIAGIPIAGVALHSWSSGGAGMASAWALSPPPPTTAAAVASSSSQNVILSRSSLTSFKGSHRSSNYSIINNRKNSMRLFSTSIDENFLQSLHLTPELQMMTQAFASIPDEKTRHKQLLYMASKLPDVSDSVRVPENKVPGCLSTVHVDCVVEKKMDREEEQQLVVNYFGDSDGLLTKGLLALLIRGLSGCTHEQINAVDPQFIQAAKISQTLTPGRNNGFLNMLAVMKKKATEAVERERNNSLVVEAEGDIHREDDVDTISRPSPENGKNLQTANNIVSSFDPIDGKPMYNTILSTLITMLKPTSIQLTDTSYQHAGHAGSKGWEESGESHFELMVVAEAFEGLNLVKRHKLIYMLLGEVMPKIHALTIVARTPSE